MARPKGGAVIESQQGQRGTDRPPQSGFNSFREILGQSLEDSFATSAGENRKQREHDAAQKEADRFVRLEESKNLMTRMIEVAQSGAQSRERVAEIKAAKTKSGGIESLTAFKDIMEMEGLIDEMLDEERATVLRGELDAIKKQLAGDDTPGPGTLLGAPTELPFQSQGLRPGQFQENVPGGPGVATGSPKDALLGANPIAAAMEPQGPPAAMMQKMLQVPMESLGLNTMESQANFNAVQKKIPNIKELMLDPNVARDVVSAIRAIGSTQGDHVVTLNDIIKILKDELAEVGGGRFRGSGATGSF